MWVVHTYWFVCWRGPARIDDMVCRDSAILTARKNLYCKPLSILNKSILRAGGDPFQVKMSIEVELLCPSIISVHNPAFSPQSALGRATNEIWRGSCPTRQSRSIRGSRRPGADHRVRGSGWQVVGWNGCTGQRAKRGVENLQDKGVVGRSIVAGHEPLTGPESS